MQMKYAAAAVLSLVVSTLMGVPPATAAPTPPPVGGEHRLRPGALAPKTGDVRAPSARASLAGWDELLRDGITLLHRSVPVTTKPVTGKGATRADFDGDGRDDIAATSDDGMIVRYSSAPRRDFLRTAAPDGACSCFNG